GRLVVIHPLSEHCITPLGYDLRIGFAASLNSSGRSETTRDKILIPALTSTFVVSKEHVWLSGGLIGTLHSRGSLAAKGLILNSTTIDPNWSGQLTFLIFNSSDKDVVLDLEETFVTLILHKTLTATRSGPATNPITVANNYGTVFGAASTHLLFEYLNSADNLRLQREFLEMVQKARSPSLGRLLLDSWRSIFPKGRLFFQNRAMDWLFKGILILGLIGDVLSFLAWEICRDFLRRHINVDVGPYDNKVLALQVTTFF